MEPLTLSTAYATWVRGENDGQWIVRNSGGEPLWELPRTWNEKGCMIAIRLGRKYELEAFNKGIDFGKEKVTKITTPIINKLNRDIEELAAMNDRLSTQLEKFIIGDD